MSDKLFSKNELYDLVNAQDSALAMEEASGMPSGWYDFASEETYRDRIEQLSCGEAQFEEDLKKTAMALRNRFEDLLDLSEDEFSTMDEFEQERHDMEESILYYIEKKLKNYCKEA
jgi:hypothetical protein